MGAPPRLSAPSSGTLRRVLTGLDGEELDRAVGAWLRHRAACDEQGWTIALDGKDVNGSEDMGIAFMAEPLTFRREPPSSWKATERWHVGASEPNTCWGVSGR